MKKNITTQEWINIEKVFNNGIIKTKDNKYIKIIKVNSINFNLKSNLEKEAILNSYKIFLKTCNFNIQILIQSSKEKIEENIKIIEENIKKENNEKLKKLSENYINFIQDLNSLKNSATKNFYIVISNNSKDLEEFIFQDLKEKYLKIKESLFRCGNLAYEIDNKNDIKEILNLFYNSRKYLN